MSKKHDSEATRANALANRIKCRHCEQSFTPQHFNQRLCSDECKIARNKILCGLWSKNNKEGRKKYHARRWAENKDYYKDRSFRDRYGIGLDDIKKMLEFQHHECTICGDRITIDNGPNSPDRAHVDHCHATGQVRDMLCTTCNFMLGGAKDNIAILEAGIRYLKEWSRGQ